MAAPTNPTTSIHLQIAATLAAAVISTRQGPSPKEAVEIWRQVYAYMTEKR